MTQFAETQRKLFDALKDTNVGPMISQALKTKRPKDREYVVATAHTELYPIIWEHDVIIVAGSYFGDEGKGKMTDAIARHPDIDLVLRVNSGENAGHTVYHDDKKMVFHITPSAICIPGKRCGIGPEAVMDPVNFFNREIKQLIYAKVEYIDRLWVGNVHIVGPYHKLMDFALSKSNSSTLTGMKYVHALSKFMKKGPRMDDLFNGEDNLRKKIEEDLEIYYALMDYFAPDSKMLLKHMDETAKTRTVPTHLFEFACQPLFR
jgi:adenylosuccinate synthase